MTRHANLSYLLKKAADQELLARTHHLLIAGKTSKAIKDWSTGVVTDEELQQIVACSRLAREQLHAAAQEVRRIKRLMEEKL